MHSKKNYIYSIALAALLLLAPGISYSQVAITAVPFLQIEPDSRSAGMGNAGVALADNASAVFWNPAGLAFQEGHEFSLTHSSWLPEFDVDMFYNYVSGRYYVEGIGSIGGHITYLNLGEQVRTDETGQELGTFSSYDLSFGLSYAFKLNDNFSLGTGLRYVYSNLVPEGTDVSGQTAQNGTSIGLDLAALYRSNEFSVGNRAAQVRAGMNLSNLGPSIQYTDEEQKDPMPALLRVGWAYTMDIDSDGFNTITFTNDFSKIMARNDEEGIAMNPLEALFNSWDTWHNELDNVDVPLSEQIMIGVGAEYWYDNLFALRAGYFYESPNNGDREFLTFGAGLRYNMFGVDFSYIYTLEEQHPLANTLRFTALLSF